MVVFFFVFNRQEVVLLKPCRQQIFDREANQTPPNPCKLGPRHSGRVYLFSGATGPSPSSCRPLSLSLNFSQKLIPFGFCDANRPTTFSSYVHKLRFSLVGLAFKLLLLPKVTFKTSSAIDSYVYMRFFPCFNETPTNELSGIGSSEISRRSL